MGVLTMMRGDTRVILVPVSNLDSLGNVLFGSNGVLGWLFWLTAKRDVEDADALAVFQKLPAAWTVLVAGNATTPAQITCTLAPTDTSGLPGHQITLVYDVQAKDTNGDIYTIDSGTITVEPDVTQVTS